MTTVRQILLYKGQRVFSIEPEASVFQALRMMAEKDIGALLVVRDDQVVGIFSERDYARMVADTGLGGVDLPVRDLMTASVLGVHMDTPLEECMALMTEKHIRHLPVMEDNRLVGMVSIGDIVRAMIADRDSLIRGLENYIVGKENPW